MQEHGIRPTANRITIARALSLAKGPVSVTELEQELETIDKSVIFRSLTLFRDNHLVHVLEDGDDLVRYELCRSGEEGPDDDLHAHFFCTSCHRTFCLEDIPIPEVKLPGGFTARGANFMIKGLCPDCSLRLQGSH